MTNEQIDNVLKSVINDDINGLAGFIDDYNTRNIFLEMMENAKSSGEINNEIFLEAFRNIMSQIENEGYEYFCKCCGENEIGKIFLFSATDEHKKACIEGKIEGILLEDYEKCEMLKTIEDEAYKKACIEGKIEGILLESSEKCKILRAIEDEAYKIAYIEGKIEGVELERYEKLSIIKTINDISHIENWVDSQELSDQTREILKVYIEINRTNNEVEVKHEINLPPQVTIGMEIENEGEKSDIIQALFSYGNWSAKHDGSLQNGVEIISPILHSTFEESQDIYKVTGMLNKVGQSISERCGGHIHIGADYLTSIEAYKNLMEIWGNTEEILYTISNEKGTAPREGMSKYATPITPKLQNAINSGKIEITDETALDEFVSGLKDVQVDRYSGLNLLNINNGKNTIEFRLANGTINPDLWIDNINLFGGIVVAAQELTVTQDKRKQELFLRLTEDISNEEKLPILLELVGVEPERYEERYKANVGLMKESERAFSGIEGPTKFTPKKIKEMTADVPALSQQEAIQAIVTERERQQQQQREAAQGIGLE